MNVEEGVAFARLKRLPLRLRLAHLAALLRAERVIVREGKFFRPAPSREGSITAAGGRRKGFGG